MASTDRVHLVSIFVARIAVDVVVLAVDAAVSIGATLERAPTSRSVLVRVLNHRDGDEH